MEQNPYEPPKKLSDAMRGAGSIGSAVLVGKAGLIGIADHALIRAEILRIPVSTSEEQGTGWKSKTS